MEQDKKKEIWIFSSYVSDYETLKPLGLDESEKEAKDRVEKYLETEGRPYEWGVLIRMKVGMKKNYSYGGRGFFHQTYSQETKKWTKS